LYSKAAYYNALASQYQTAGSALPSGASKLQNAFPSPVVTSVQSPLQTKASGYQQQEQGDIRAAIDLWKKAIALSPNDSSFDRPPRHGSRCHSRAIHATYRDRLLDD